MNLTSVTKKTKAEQAHDIIELAIVNCELAPGAVYSEADLAEILDMGRTPVREALVKLSSENLVRLTRAGVVIPEINPLTMLKLLELREPIERLCIQKACEYQTPSDRARFEQILNQLKPLPDDDRRGFMELLREIHLATADASKNEFLHFTLKSTQGLSRRFWFHFAEDTDQAFCREIYSDLLDALIQGQSDKAIEKSQALMVYLRDFSRQR
ncbi:GntR family transcriptional regulator [Roseibium sp. SCP14]|uniref:GntR family transcriptional regulator n=1 Tax=Roseibium sp. SCP14 TaxID=3141375 RepID=UPI00333834E7